ncbi:MAG TPA: YdcH family protein [Polyangiaceae bacterium]|jgi:uncharacterized protein YdcH (DUF465 family)|nr:YdcH family protein [Polyangiaceae bacterium]
MKQGTAEFHLNHLEARHRDLDEAVARLGRRAYLTPSEQRTVSDLKKERLLTKDRITVLRRSEPPPSR